MEAKEQMVRGLELFAGCSGAEVRWILKNADELDIRPGTTIARKGSVAREFMVVVNGCARATDGNGCVVALGPGSYFGHDEISNDRPHAMTVEATEKLRVLVFEVRAFRGLDETVPAVARRLMGDRAVRVPAPAGFGRRLAVAS
jgi:CRP-like cAMP-binding protein